MPRPKLAERFVVMCDGEEYLTNTGIWTANESLARRFPSRASAQRKADELKPLCGNGVKVIPERIAD